MKTQHEIQTTLLGEGLRLVTTETPDGELEEQLWKDEELIAVRDEGWTNRRIKRALRHLRTT